MLFKLTGLTTPHPNFRPYLLSKYQTCLNTTTEYSQLQAY